jgi:alpha-galactosidase
MPQGMPVEIRKVVRQAVVRYGIRHTVGDTSGWARALRNAPVFVELAAEINRRVPGALVLNYANPMNVLTTLLARACTGPVIGLWNGCSRTFSAG